MKKLLLVVFMCFTVILIACSKSENLALPVELLSNNGEPIYVGDDITTLINAEELFSSKLELLKDPNKISEENMGKIYYAPLLNNKYFDALVAYAESDNICLSITLMANADDDNIEVEKKRTDIIRILNKKYTENFKIYDFTYMDPTDHTPSLVWTKGLLNVSLTFAPDSLYKSDPKYIGYPSYSIDFDLSGDYYSELEESKFWNRENLHLDIQ